VPGTSGFDAALSAARLPAIAAQRAPATAAVHPRRQAAPVALPAATSVTAVPIASAIPVASAAPAGQLEAINAAVVGFFERAQTWLSALPGGPISDLVSGALLLVRRSLFNQLPTTQPGSYLTTVTGRQVGTLGVTDPEGDVVTYQLTTAPQNGTVEIAPDGTYTYTPDADHSGSDQFTITHADGGFNLLDPFGSRSTELTVVVLNTAPLGVVGSNPVLRQTFDLLNLSSNPVKLTRIGGFPGSGPLLSSPYACGYGACPPASIFEPGETARFELAGVLDYSVDIPAVLTSCASADCSQVFDQKNWFVTFHTDPYKKIFPFSDIGFLKGWMKVGNLDAPSNPGSVYTINDAVTEGSGDPNLVAFTQPGRYALLDAPGTTRTLAPTDLGAQDLFNWFLDDTAGLAPTDLGAQDLLKWFRDYAASTKPPVTFNGLTNIQFNENPPGDPGYTRQISADNIGDSPGSINRTVTSSISTMKGSNWKVGLKASWSPIEKILGFDVSGEYGQSESETNTKTFSTAVTSTVLPFSANEILTAPPKLLVTADAQFVLGTGADARTYTFTDVQYDFPNPNLTAPFYLIKTEPLQPKYTAADNVAPNLIGTSIPNVGFTLRDKKSDLISPTYKVGQRVQLTAAAYQGVGASADKTGDPRTVYTSSNAAVATVDKTGALTAVGPGTATITATYSWTIPYGNGTARNDYVLATMDVTVEGRRLR
jgi:hypothetical protein